MERMTDMVWGSLKEITNLDPTGIADKAVDTTKSVVDVGTELTGRVAETAYDTVTDPVGTLEEATDTFDRFVESATKNANISVGGMMIELSTTDATKLLYNALVPQTAQAVLRGELPSKDDFRADAMGYIGGPLEGIYVAANSESAKIINDGGTPTAEQLGRDMIAALTPVARRKLGL